ncbi:MAG TPA: hypothetical protein VMW16_02940 [Sedimentisphaerales bacterium]|nr:hypothetical protein [Sedimentisphaerales bacterium]
MNAQNLAKRLIVGIALACLFTTYVRADKLALQEKLSKEIKIELRDVTIAEALNKIGQKADVKIVLSDEAAWKLPQGEATRLSVMMQGPLAESLTEMLNAFFMRYAVGDEEITIYPRPELEHVLGRPTAEQLQLLRDVYTKPIEVYRFEDVQGTVNKALGNQVLILPVSVQQRLDETLKGLLSYFNALARTDEKVESRLKPGQQLELPTPITVAQLLDQVVIVVRDRRRNTTSEEGAAWYLSRMSFPNQIPEIRVVLQKEFLEVKLEQVVDISFKDERAEVIIQRLANWTGMELSLSMGDPSWLQEVISVDMQNVQLRQALRNVVTTVDGIIKILVEDCLIFVEGPLHTKKPVAKEPAQSKTSDYVGKISIPMEGGKYYIEFMLREKDLTDELKKLWQERMKAIIKGPELVDMPLKESSESVDKPQKMEEVH